MTLIAALLCFAANSLLCRFALAGGLIDPASFTSVRIVAGALVLAAIAPRGVANWGQTTLLVSYATCFSFAYRSMTAATGALLLFAAVQVSMIVASSFDDDKPSGRQLMGVALALAGVVYLLLPGLFAPSLSAALWMLAAGASWGLYSALGRKTPDPLDATAMNFMLAAPIAFVVSAATLESAHLTAEGVLAALIAGGITSGLGYVLWFRALRGMSGTAAAVSQLAVPPITAALAMLVLAEPLSPRLLVASVLVLTGIALTVRAPAPERLQWSDVVARVATLSSRS